MSDISASELLLPAIARGVDFFQRVMPPIFAPLPSVYICDRETYLAQRDRSLALLSRASRGTNSNLDTILHDIIDVATDFDEDMVSETVVGVLGGVIFLREDYIPAECYTCKRISNCKHATNYFLTLFTYLWTELGFYYATRCEPSNFPLFYIPNCQQSAQRQEAYWFWSNFIGATVACHVQTNYLEEMGLDIFLESWEPNFWHPVYHDLLAFYADAFVSPDFLDLAPLATAFARLCKDLTTQRFVEAANSGHLFATDEDKYILYANSPGFFQEDYGYTYEPFSPEAENGEYNSEYNSEYNNGEYGEYGDNGEYGEYGEYSDSAYYEQATFEEEGPLNIVAAGYLDPTGISRQPRILQDLLREILALLMQHTEQDLFWVVNIQLIDRLAVLLDRLQTLYYNTYSGKNNINNN